MKRLILSFCVLFSLLSRAHATVTTQQFTGTVVNSTAVTPTGFSSAPPQTRISGTLTVDTSSLYIVEQQESSFSPVYSQYFAPGTSTYDYFLTGAGVSFTLKESSLSLTVANPLSQPQPYPPYPNGSFFLVCSVPQSVSQLRTFPFAIPAGCAAGVAVVTSYRYPNNYSVNPEMIFFIDRLSPSVQQSSPAINPNKPCQCNIPGGNTPAVGRPITVATGNMYEQVTDYSTAGVNQLAFTRYYNSLGNTASFAQSLGLKWRSNFDRYLRINSSSSMTAERPTGQEIDFTLQNGIWVPDSDVDYTLTSSGSTTWLLTDSNDTVETYSTTTLENQIKINATGARLQTIQSRNGYTQTLTYDGSNELTTVTDSYQRALSFAYQSGLLQTVTTPDALVITYAFAASGVTPGGVLDRLASATYSNGSQTSTTSQSYLYGSNAFPLAMTSMVDENGNRFMTWTYDSLGRATSSQLGTGTAASELTSLAYDNATGNATVSNALGETETYKFTLLQGVPKATEIDRLATTTTASATRSFSFDSNGYTSSQTDWNGSKTVFVNNTHGQPVSIVEASGSSITRTTSIAYDSVWVHLPAKVTAPGVTTEFTYDGNGNPLTRKLTDTTTTTAPYPTQGQTRTSTFTWGSYGLLATAKGPRTDVDTTSSLSYNTSGSLTKVTNALGQSVQVTQNTPGGRPLTIVDPNGVTTQLTYDSRQRLTSQAVTTGAGVLTSSFAYDAAGNLTSTTQPDGSTLTNSYDASHRLTQVTDSLGNYVSYVLDALGDRTGVNVYALNGTAPTWQRSATFDALGRLLVNTGGASQTTTQTYDSNGNVLTTADGLSQTTTNTYDALNRLSASTDANSAVTTPGYDAQDHVTSVQDANGNTTSYVRDGFGEVIQQTSPDSGTTTFVYDADGNQTKKTDALSIVTNQTFDALDRPLTTSYPAHTVENVSYTYDQTGTGFSFGMGRLTSVTDQAGSLTRTYDERGNLTSEKRVNGSTVLTTSYSYDGANRVVSMTHPDGTLVTYQHDAAGYLSNATAKLPGASTATQIAAFTHQPFGPIGTVTYGNGVTEAWTFDQSYRPTNITDALSATNLQKLTYDYDLANNVKSITDAVNAANSQTLVYDSVNRLTSATSGTNGYGTLKWTYDKVGNRLTQVQGSTTTTYGYTPGSNRLATITLGTTTTSALKPESRLAPRRGLELPLLAHGPPSPPPSLGPAPRRLPSQPHPAPLTGYLGWSLLTAGFGGILSLRKRLRNNLFLTILASLALLGGSATLLTGCIFGTSSVVAPLAVVATPTFSLASGTYTAAQTVTLSDSTSGAAIFYTTNGATPTSSSTPYTGPITVSATETLEAIATATNYINSAVATATYTISPPAIVPAVAPGFSPGGGTYTAAQTVTLSDPTPGAAIYYTINGTVPTANSILYTAPITVSASATLQAIAIASGYSNSPVSSASYVINIPVAATPLISPGGGTYNSPQTVTLSDATPGARIYYTTNGSMPTTNSTQYSGPIALTGSSTIEAIAVASGYTNSSVASATYTITPAAVSAPVFTVAAGTYAVAQTVTIFDQSPNTTIYYTVDGSIPTTASSLYVSPIRISTTATLSAIAVASDGRTTSPTTTALYKIVPVVATPVITPSGGEFTSPQTVSIADATPGSTIYYTVSGQIGTKVYTGPFGIGGSDLPGYLFYVTAYATADGYSQSDLGLATIVVLTSNASQPLISPNSEAFTGSIQVSISSATTGSTIHYTTDGSTPTASSTVYTGPITVSVTETISAIVVASGYNNSGVSRATYTLSQTTPTPVISPATGTYTAAQTVVISDALPGAAIYYTLDGTAPTSSSTRYTGPITVSSTETIAAIAVADGYSSSAVASATFTLNLQTATPTFSPAAGTFMTVQSVTLSDSTPAATIYYTTNGTQPTTSSSVYTAPITVSETETLEAIAVASGYAQSLVASANYIISLPAAATPMFSPAGGIYNSAQLVSLSDITPGATIYYTTDGTTPTQTSTLYIGPISVASTETVQAIATASGFASSAVGTAAYTITSPVTTITTNANGNITSILPANGYVNATFSYNNANRLQAVTGSPTAASFIYDYAGQRFSKTDNGNPPTIYSYAQGGTLIAENDNGTVTDHIYADGRPIAQIQPGVTPSANQVSYVLADRLGTPQRLVNGSGTTIWSTTYQPFGTTGTVNATVNQNLRFPGQLADAETGFSYNHFRDYMPNLGRYLESDPIGLGGGPNTYVYVGSRPLRITDKLGLQAAEDEPEDARGRGGIVESTPELLQPLITQRYANNRAQLRDLDPDNPSLSIVTSPEWQPTEEDVAELQAQLDALQNPKSPTDQLIQGGSCGTRNSYERQALIDMARQDKRLGGISTEDFKAYQDLNSTLEDPFSEPDQLRADPGHPTAKQPTSRAPHVHIGPINHIPLTN